MHLLAMGMGLAGMAGLIPRQNFWSRPFGSTGAHPSPSNPVESAVRFAYRWIPMSQYLSSIPEVSDEPEVTLAPAEPCFEPDLVMMESEDMAQRELYLSLQLLVNRAQRLSLASAATIAVAQGGQLLCRASAGPMAAEIGTELRAYPTVIQRSIEAHQIICCNDTGNLAHPNGTLYADLGIKSMMVMPVMRDERSVAMLELLADRTQAFRDRDGAMMERLSEMVLIALERADAAKHARQEITANITSGFRAEIEGLVTSESQPLEGDPSPAEPSRIAEEIEKVRTCQACGFPVSDGRTFCVDCEEARRDRESTDPPPSFLTKLEREESRSWFESHFYTLGTLLMVLLTVLVLLLKFH
jgi:GAF domain